MKKKILLLPAIRDILNADGYSQKICEAFSEVHPRKITDSFIGLNPCELAKAIFSFPLDKAIRVFEYFDDREKKDILFQLEDQKQILVISNMSHDERIDLLKILPLRLRSAILRELDQQNKDDIKLLYSYKEGSVGSIITTDCAYVSDTDTVQNVLTYLYQNSTQKKIIYYIYVVNDNHKLLGLVSLRQLMLAKSDVSIKDIMKTEIIKVHVNDDQLESAKIIKNFDFLALPAVDDDETLIGIVTVDDVVELVVEKQTEKMLSLAAAGKHIPYLSSSFVIAAKSRFLWLFILIGVGFISGYVLERYQFVLDEVLPLIFFIPLLCASAGNAGTQSATVVIRELTTGGIDLSDLSTVLKKELSVGLLLGFILGFLCFLKSIFFSSSLEIGFKIGLTVAFSMIGVISIATSCGALFPIIFKKINLDPALMSAPLIASVVDVCSLLIYLELARLFFLL